MTQSLVLLNTLRVAKILPHAIPAKVAIHTWLITHNQSQAWMARRLKVSDAVLSRMLNGQRELDDDLVKGIRKLTGIDIRELSQVA